MYKRQGVKKTKYFEHSGGVAVVFIYFQGLVFVRKLGKAGNCRDAGTAITILVLFVNTGSVVETVTDMHVWYGY